MQQEELNRHNQQMLEIAVANAGEIFRLEQKIEFLMLTVEQLRSRLRAEELVQATVDSVWAKIREQNGRLMTENLKLRERVRTLWLERVGLRDRLCDAEHEADEFRANQDRLRLENRGLADQRDMLKRFYENNNADAEEQTS